MSRPVLPWHDSRLRQPARPLTAVDGRQLPALIEDMRATMQANHGVGLAAPQIGVGLRVRRHRRLRFTALNPHGECIEQVAEGFHARVIQHECDHLDGILFPERMPDDGDFLTKR